LYFAANIFVLSDQFRTLNAKFNRALYANCLRATIWSIKPMKSSKIIMSFTIAATLGVMAFDGASAHHKDKKDSANNPGSDLNVSNSKQTQKTAQPVATKTPATQHKK
jgi:hypothetical protein